MTNVNPGGGYLVGGRGREAAPERRLAGYRRSASRAMTIR